MTKQTNKSELSEILDSHLLRPRNREIDLDELEQAIEAYYNKRFEAAIGEDERIFKPQRANFMGLDVPASVDTRVEKHIDTRNKVRAEARKRWNAPTQA
jgi:hypothetical protein